MSTIIEKVNDLNRMILAGEGLAAFYQLLLEHQLGPWHPRDNVPKTKALANQKLHGLGNHMGVVHHECVGHRQHNVITHSLHLGRTDRHFAIIRPRQDRREDRVKRLVSRDHSQFKSHWRQAARDERR